MTLLETIRKNKALNMLLLQECDIYFYEQIQKVQFSDHGETYSLSCQAFAQDGSGGEYVFLEEGSIGFISSEGEVGRVSESLKDLLTFLIHAGCLSDFSCKHFYKSEVLLEKFCTNYLLKIREDYKAKGQNWDEVRGKIALALGLSFHPEALSIWAMQFYKAAIREPAFSCHYLDEEKDYRCDSVLSDSVGMWTMQLVGMSREEIENYSD